MSAACSTVWLTSCRVGQRYTTRSRYLRRLHSAMRRPTSVLPLPVGSCRATSGLSLACDTYALMISFWWGMTSGIRRRGSERKSCSRLSGTDAGEDVFLKAIVCSYLRAIALRHSRYLLSRCEAQSVEIAIRGATKTAKPPPQIAGQPPRSQIAEGQGFEPGAALARSRGAPKALSLRHNRLNRRLWRRDSPPFSPFARCRRVPTAFLGVFLRKSLILPQRS